MGKPLARALGDFIAGLQFHHLPPQAVQTARTGIIDCIGVIVVGNEEPPVRILRRALTTNAAQGEASLLGSRDRVRTTAPEAAWINGAAGHVLDYDDVAIGHPSVVIVPGILAEGEVLDAGGAEIIAAYVAGYEVWIELVRRERGNHQIKGWHPTSMLGALAATAACANLRRLTAEQSTHALGIAAAQACGITASYGTMAKSFQVGKAAHTGVLSARLAALGMTASPEVLDHDRGLLKAISPAGDVDTSTSPNQLGIDWHICKRGLDIKRYPVCYCAHRTIDAVLGLTGRTPIPPEQIERIEATLSEIHATILINHLPQAALAAKFSVEFAIASTLVAGEVSLKQLNDEFVRRSDVQDLMRKVTVVTNQDYDPNEPAFSMHDQVRIFLKNGEVLESEKVRYARGNARLPLAPGDLERKFMDCVAVGNPELDGKALLGMLQQLETLPSCRLLTQSL